MRTEQYQTKKLAALLGRRKIATLEQLQEALGHPTPRTVFRKLETMTSTLARIGIDVFAKTRPDHECSVR